MVSLYLAAGEDLDHLVSPEERYKIAMTRQ
jgi:hypothetical protein